MSPDRQRLAQKIKALMLKTAEQGCTEAEAMAAADKAAELIRIYQMNMTDLDLEAEGFIMRTLTKDELKTYKLQEKVWTNILWGVGRFTDCRAYPYHFGSAEIYGLRSDVEFAEWLFDALCHFIRRAAQSQALFLSSKAEVNQFTYGCSVRIYERLRDEASKRSPAPASNGRDVVVAKNSLRDREFSQFGRQLGRGMVRTGQGGAYSQGYVAGSKVGFGRPVGSATQRITKG